MPNLPSHLVSRTFYLYDASLDDVIHFSIADDADLAPFVINPAKRRVGETKRTRSKAEGGFEACNSRSAVLSFPAQIQGVCTAAKFCGDVPSTETKT